MNVSIVATGLFLVSQLMIWILNINHFIISQLFKIKKSKMRASSHFLIHFFRGMYLLRSSPFTCIVSWRFLGSWISTSTKTIFVIFKFNSSSSSDGNRFIKLGKRFFTLFTNMSKIFFLSSSKSISPIFWFLFIHYKTL